MQGAAQKGWTLAYAVLGTAIAATIAAEAGAPVGALRDVVYVAAYAALAGLTIARALHPSGRGRRAWAFIGAGILLWGLAWGGFYLAYERAYEAPSWCDVVWHLGYACWYVGLVLLARAHQLRQGTSVWLDGLIAALAAAGLCAAIELEAVLGSLAGDGWTMATLLAYPIADMVLIAFVVTSFAGSEWGRTPSGRLLLGGFALLVAADALFLVENANGAYDVAGEPYDMLWLVACALLARAAWSRREWTTPSHWKTTRLTLLPIVFSAVALGVDVSASFTDLNAVAALLSAGALAAALVRLVFTLREAVALADSRRLSLTDELTGLGNRRFFLSSAEAALARAERSGEPAALVLLDLDQFKELNDTLGHHAGDELLRRLGGRVAETLREDDTIARLGGDEFGVLLEHAGADEARAALERLLKALNEPFSLDGITINLGASAGIALYPEHAEDVSTLMRRADLAMYEAKRLHADHVVYARGDDHTSRDRLSLAGEFSRALAAGEIILHYQPIVNAADGAITGAEALVRWQHPERGLLGPGAFLPSVQRTGLMRALTRHVVQTAVAQAAAWHAQRRAWKVAVNATAADLLDAGFVSEVAAVLERYGVAPDALVIEVTESVVLADPERATAAVHRLRELGVRVALDDFGTGYSSLSHLQQLPVTAIKVDRAFVQSMEDDRAAAAIVESVVRLADALDMQVVAEGIETPSQYVGARTLGCHYVQGFAISPPIAADDLARRADEFELRALAAA